jgi:hypothetical protein
MTTIVRAERAAEKAQMEGNSVPPPGPELIDWIRDAVRDGRPAWKIGTVPGPGQTLWIPRTRMFRLAADGRFDLCPPVKPLDAVLRPRLAIAIETDHPQAHAELTAHDVTAGRRLWAAALRDLAGWTERQVATECLLPERKVREAVRSARLEWHLAGAWPWSSLHPEGRPGTITLRDARLSTVVRIWRSGRFPAT